MKAEIQFVDLDVSESLETYVQNKLDKLGKKFDWVIHADVFLKKEPHPNEKNCKCEIRLSVPGPLLFAHESADNFEQAVSEVIEQLEIQLEKRKSKMKSY